MEKGIASTQEYKLPKVESGELVSWLALVIFHCRGLERISKLQKQHVESLLIENVRLD